MKFLTISGKLYRSLLQCRGVARSERLSFAPLFPEKSGTGVDGSSSIIAWHNSCSVRLIRTKQHDMRNSPSLCGRLLIVATLALPAFFLAACASAPTTESAGDYASDASVTARVKTALLADPGLKSLAVSVSTYRGVVVLSGTVNSEEQIRKAVAVTRSVSGVQSVNNDLHVKPQ
ncbi:BON domain-containing protein [Caballeronia sp. GAWG1-5s-s]|uniref:BON domain-containing protein n=1 Tax=Caballeronia sp. GAWG1-5s-s TaxID=2921743 RepID=UPI0032EDDB98